jgi:hypothetical protein
MALCPVSVDESEYKDRNLKMRSIDTRNEPRQNVKCQCCLQNLYKGFLMGIKHLVLYISVYCLFNRPQFELFIFHKTYLISVGIATGYWLDDRGVGIRLPEWVSYYFLLHSVQTGSPVHPASHQMGTGGSFPGGKAAGARSKLLNSI